MIVMKIGKIAALGLMAASFATTTYAQAKLSDSLARMDKNSDGKLSVEEWSADKPLLLKKVDANKDGTLSTDEIKTYYVKIAPLEDPKTTKRIEGITGADANADGTVTLDEMISKAGDDFKKRDRDGDGFLTGAD